MHWILQDLFENVKVYQKEMKSLEQDILHYSVKIQEISDIFPNFIDKIWEWKERLGKLEIYANLTYYLDIQNSLCLKRKQTMERFCQKMQEKITCYEQNMFSFSEEEILNFLKEHSEFAIYSRYMKQLFLEHRTSSIEGEKCIKESQKILGDIILKYNSLRNSFAFGSLFLQEEEVNLSFQNVRFYQTHKERSVRKQVFEQVFSVFQAHHEELFSQLKKIFEQRKTICNLKGYSSVLACELSKSELDESFFFHLRDCVTKHIFLFQKYLDLKASYFSLSHPHFYDYSAPMMDYSFSGFSFGESIEKIHQVLEILGDDYKTLLDQLIAKGHIDSSLDIRKHPTIVFTWYAYSFLHFRGEMLDIKDLIHEIGHMMNDALSISHCPFVYAVSSNFIGEIVSIVNETLLTRFCIMHARTKEEELFYLNKEIENYVSSVFRPMMFTEFEDYFAREFSHISFSDACSFYETLLQKYYGNCVSPLSAAKSEWLQYDKYYRVSYYSIHYVSGKLLANVIVDALLHGSLAPSLYLDFLASGSSKSTSELLEMLHLSTDDSSLFDTGFSFLKKDLKRFEELLME